MKKLLLKKMLFVVALLCVGQSAWAYSPTLKEDLSVAGYVTKAYYDIASTNVDDMCPTEGDFRYRGSGYGLFNYGSGNRGADVALTFAKDDIIIFEFKDSQNRRITINSVGNCTKDETLSTSTGYLVYKADADAGETTNINVGRGGCIVAILVMEKDNTVETADFTINYLLNGEGEPVKTSTGTLAVGSIVNTDATFFVDDVKYFRADGQPESFNIVSGDNTYNVNIRKAGTYEYYLITWNSKIDTVFVHGYGFEGETVNVGYPRYVLTGNGVFGESEVTNKEYRKPIVLSEDNVSATVDYAAKDNINVVFYAEGENITGFSTSVANNIPVRASNAKAGVTTEDVVITALPAGKYILHVGAFTSKSSEQKIYIGYGETQYAFASSGNLNETASVEFTLTEETAIKYFGTASSTDAQFDYIYIEKTGDYVAPAKEDIVYTAPEGIEGLVANGEAQALITAGTVEAGGEMQYSLDGENFSTEIPTATEAKKYTVYYRIVADDTHNDVAAQEIFVTIISAEVDAAQKELVAAIEAAKAIDTEGKNGAEDLAAAITAAEAAIFADDVTVSVVNTAKENLAAAVAEFEKANKKDIVYTAPVAVEGLVANGDQLNLIKAGTVEEGGEMQYSLDGENFSTEIPTATEAAKYTVYYRIVADETHNDVAAQTIVVTVAEPEKIYIVAGSSSEIFGLPWDGTNNANQMTMNDNGTYSKTYTVEGSVDDVSLKVVRNGSDWFGDAENLDVKFNLTGAGTFTVTFNPETSIVSVTGDIVEFPAVEYDITIAEGIENGTVAVEPTSAKAGDEVTITATPAEGYELASVSVTGVNSNQAVAVADGKFTMPEDAVTVSATFKKKAIYIETDLTSQFSALTNWQNWTGATGFTATNFCPAVAINDGTAKQVCEKYESTCATTGDVFYQTITGLAAGTYKIELYGGAAYTFGRGFSSEAFSEGTWNAGDKIEPSAEVSTGVVLSATTSEGTYGGEIPIYYATNFPDGAATVTLDGVKVGANGELRIGMSKTSQSTNWHVVQLKGVTAQVDAIELHAVTLASAQAALSAEVNAVVVGEEKTALEAAIANNSEVTELTSEAYETAINALKAATNAFTSAREAYAALASTKESLVEYAKKYVYASAEKTAAVTAAAEGEPTSAADATSKNANLIAALRAMAESHANAEGVEGAEAIAITNPSAEDSTNGWTTVNGEGSDGSIGIRDNEPWTSADGSTAHKYFDGGNWGASAWDVSLTQNVELAAGKYMLSVVGRASGDVALTLFAGENKAAMPAINATGGLFDRGWNLSSVEFEVEAKSAVTIGVQGVTNVIHNWMSFSDFKLVLIESYAVRVAKAELLEAINEAKAIDTEYKDGAEELAAAITVAEGVYNNEEATVEGVNTAKSDLAAAVAAFNTANAKYSELTYTITGQSSIKATIKKGKAVLDIIPEEGWAVSELNVNGEDALEQLADNKLVVNVDADATLVEVTFGWADAENMYEEDEVTGIANIADEGIRVYAQGNQICVEGAAGKIVRVYTLYGSLLNTATPSENKVAKFSVAAGTYVVQVGNKAAKISVK